MLHHVSWYLLVNACPHKWCVPFFYHPESFILTTGLSWNPLQIPIKKKTVTSFPRRKQSRNFHPNLLLIDVTAFPDTAPIIQILLGTLTLHQRDLWASSLADVPRFLPPTITRNTPKKMKGFQSYLWGVSFFGGGVGGILMKDHFKQIK